MVLSKRERYIAIGVGLAVAALVLDRWALTPLWNAMGGARQREANAMADLDSARSILANSNKLAPWWREKLATGIKGDPMDAEMQLFGEILAGELAAGLKPGPTKPDRPPEKTQLPQVTFTFTEIGRMSALRAFLWRVQNAAVPVRITELTITTQKPGTDELTAVMKLSSVYAPGVKRAAAQSRPAPASGPSSTTGAAR